MGILDPDTGRIRIGSPRRIVVEHLPPEEKPKPDNLPNTKPGKPDPGLFPDGYGGNGGNTDTVKPDSILRPGKPDPGLFPDGYGGNGGNGDNDSSEPFELTEDQKYMLIGLAVLGAFFGFFKR